MSRTLAEEQLDPPRESQTDNIESACKQLPWNVACVWPCAASIASIRTRVHSFEHYVQLDALVADGELLRARPKLKRRRQV
jgi:hypothetical protein